MLSLGINDPKTKKNEAEMDCCWVIEKKDAEGKFAELDGRC